MDELGALRTVAVSCGWGLYTLDHDIGKLLTPVRLRWTCRFIHPFGRSRPHRVSVVDSPSIDSCRLAEQSFVLQTNVATLIQRLLAVDIMQRVAALGGIRTEISELKNVRARKFVQNVCAYADDLLD